MKIQKLQWRDFEFLIGELWSRYGFIVEVTHETAKGRDVDAWNPSTGEQYLVECKRWDVTQNKISASRMQKYIDKSKRENLPLILCTTSRFGPSARRAIKGTDVTLYDVGEVHRALRYSHSEYLIDVYHDGHSSINSLSDIQERLSSQGINLEESLIKRIFASEHPFKMIECVEQAFRDEPVYKKYVKSFHFPEVRRFYAYMDQYQNFDEETGEMVDVQTNLQSWL